MILNNEYLEFQYLKLIFWIYQYKINLKTTDIFKQTLKSGPDPICESLNYADFAFKVFWEKAKHKSA